MSPIHRPRASKALVSRINRREARHKGMIVAIEPESGDYYIAVTSMDAFRRARARHPGKAFVFKRIGYRWTHRQTGGLKRIR
jgi:hypothetical protein